MRPFTLPALLLLSTAALSQQPDFLGYAADRPDSTLVTARLQAHEPGERYAIYAVNHGDPLDYADPAVLPVAGGWLDGLGDGVAAFSMPPRGELPEGFALDLYALMRGSSGPTIIGPATVPLTGGVGFCQRLDFDHALGQVPDPVAGQVIAGDWAAVGMNIHAINAVPGHPDLAIVFDSANPTGGDDDLATPGRGMGNDEPLGKLLIIAENNVDADEDGFIDDPDDEHDGGVLVFDFDLPVLVCSLTLVDIDDGENTLVRFWKDGVPTEIRIDDAGDNSVQTISFLQERVDRMEIVLGGSGGLAEAMIEPCPLLVNLDENPFGVPVDVAAGTVVTDQFADLGLHFSGINNTPGHPDKVVLFDSENPTGGDDDLMTPGRGEGNDTPLGLVLIIAENDVDADEDGLIDDPDDEAGGGRMILEFDGDVTFFSATVLDVDGTEEDVFEFFDADGFLIETIQIGALGDNSVQTLTPDTPLVGVRRIEMAIGGSGAITRLRWCPGIHVPEG